ncbi:hypothetical protein [Polynucleobacter sp. CS-Odin-A6]|uniref:hypothetical protein n=1 Tax=Polynucleobacter sp. CS-Odin-A6 TaxID=2689106 RepID=UPI001C0E4189|nr:hypothetical protein [Polynucleobacter sp. CS-Odin-A6]MBU3620887.1 hypothetical protein [Polynucleobacter sp. CS-Odin-A6]
MAHSNTVKLNQAPLFSSKPLYAIKDFFSILAESFAEAKAMEQKSRKTSGNW